MGLNLRALSIHRVVAGLNNTHILFKGLVPKNSMHVTQSLEVFTESLKYLQKTNLFSESRNSTLNIYITIM
jgi:hypothetical protein